MIGEEGKWKVEKLTPVAPGLDAIEHVLAALALDAADYETRQVAVEVLLLLRRQRGLLYRLGGAGCCEAGRGAGRAFDCAAGDFGCGSRSGFGVARRGQFEIEGSDFGLGLGEGLGEV
jgi:hypothetical protein